MIYNIIFSSFRYAALLFCGFYSFLKLSKQKADLKILTDAFAAAVLGVAVYFITFRFTLLIPAAILVFIFIYALPRFKKSIYNTLALSVVSCGISISVMAAAFLITLPLSFVFYIFIKNDEIKNCAMLFSVSAVQIICAIFLFRIKRFKSGISLQKNDGNTEMFIFASILCILLMTLMCTENVLASLPELILLGILVCGFILIIWWRKYITNNYKKQLYNRNESIYEERIAAYEKEKAELLKQNEALSKIIHRDNKLVAAMVSAVKKLTAKSQNAEIEELLSELKFLADEHKNIITAYEADTAALPTTRVISLNAVVHFLYSKAEHKGIASEFDLDENAVELLYKTVYEKTDVNTIICDLGENAIIASGKTANGRICAALKITSGNAPSILVYDNGDYFDEKVIASMGRKRITTRASEGGSGIGLMTLFETLQKYNASYLMSESPDREGFTKCVQISFDGANEIRIVSCRDKIKKAAKLRGFICDSF